MMINKSDLVEWLQLQGQYIKAKRAARELGCSTALAGRLLSQLAKEGYVRKDGGGRWEVLHVKLDGYSMNSRKG